ncbi:hypothetical protein CYJ27_01075 [Aerococcus christensenii]|uniref:Phosphoenolpyruvate-dependent sugar phosphotransferase system, EIIA 2 n=1 Tax=Aerococcus christensenii TaxID=87541 RepID=A0A109RDP2_9LACT|nr:PTS sugar transporter subunit IIA [Aerococcus christensenii]AMB92215.1 hypothetical protein AWM71_02255 [Aerococcus christensenii]KXB37683.1 phosphoenolpyruvate-dependent sugar phosphotransferase system, EIIA 2 [Aerococcus christensenii]MDK8233326.1 PTS sugar transporter subunit IIA [Aerococcus christensenii]PKY92056.1 hypothetical protein CYJ27_01075 [Aerococcus christensenii]WEB70812.1 PTS sugar transporter subunit IIA [Aerococcus christensenii]
MCYEDYLKVQRFTQFADRSAYYSQLMKQLTTDFKEEMSHLQLEDFMREREELGSVQIGSYTVMPHMEAEEIPSSKIYLFLLEKPFYWNDQASQIRIILTLFICPKKDSHKEKIRQVIRHFAEPHIEQKLLNSKDNHEVFNLLTN